MLVRFNFSILLPVFYLAIIPGLFCFAAPRSEAANSAAPVIGKLIFGNSSEPRISAKFIRQAQAQKSSEASLVYKEVKNSENIAVLEQYISSFPKSIYAKLALVRIRELKKQQANKELSRQQKIAQSRENQRQEKLREANQEWDALKSSEDEPALNRFITKYADTHYAQNAKSRVKHLKSLRKNSEIGEGNQQSDLVENPRRSEISATPRLISKHNTWSAYRLKNSSKQATCYVAAEPIKMAPVNRNHGDIFFMLTKYATNRNFEPHFTVGYPFKPSSSVEVNIDGRTFKMFTRDNDAWIEDANKEHVFLLAMKSAVSMELSGFSPGGAAVRYHFSLDGVNAALSALKKCS